MDMAVDPIPPSPEQWHAIVEKACADSGWGDEVVVAVESTLTGWKVIVNPVTHPATDVPDGGVSS